MNIVDYIMIAILLLYAWKGFRVGLLPMLVNLAGTFLIFIVAFYIKQPISVLLYENLPFLEFAGIFKGILALNILLYEGIAYFITIVLLWIVLKVIKKLSLAIQNFLSITLFMNIPSKLIGAVLGACEGVLLCFILLFIASFINKVSPYINDSKYSSMVLNDIPVLNDVTSDLVKSSNEVYNVIINNQNDVIKANLESVKVLMKYNILSYESAKKLVEDKKLDIVGVDAIIEEYKGVTS